MNTKKYVTIFSIITSVFLVGLIFSPLQSVKASQIEKTPSTLGGIDINSYCAYEWNGVYRYNGIRCLQAGQAVLIGPKDAYSWRCKVTLFGENGATKSYLKEINLTNACKWQYENNNAFARTRNSANPYSWKCYK